MGLSRSPQPHRQRRHTFKKKSRKQEKTSHYKKNYTFVFIFISTFLLRHCILNCFFLSFLYHAAKCLIWGAVMAWSFSAAAAATSHAWKFVGFGTLQRPTFLMAAVKPIMSCKLILKL